MTIADYTTLRSEVQAYCGRSDSTFAARFPTFVALAEDRIYLGYGSNPADPLYTEAVRSKIMETEATVTMTAGEGTLPNACLGIRRITRTSDQIGLDYLTPDHFALREAQNTGGDPGYYTIEGVTLKVVPSYTGSLTILYFKRFDAITSDAPTGSMLTEYGPLYFAATMFEAFSFMQEVDLALAWLARYRAAAAAINRNAVELRYSGRRLRINAKPIG